MSVHAFSCSLRRVYTGLLRYCSRPAQTSIEDKEAGHGVSAINCYFMCQVQRLTYLGSQSAGCGLVPHHTFNTFINDTGVASNLFCLQDGSMFQANVRYTPYFYLQIKVGLGTLRQRPCSTRCSVVCGEY